MPALALVASLLWGWADYAGGTATRRMHPLAVTGVAHVIGFLALLGWALLDGGLSAWADWLPLAMVGGVFGYLGLAALYAGLARGPMGVVAPIAATGAVVPVLYDLARGAVPPPVQLAGIALALLGCVLASGVEVRGGTGGLVSISLAAFAAVSFGALLIIVARGSETYPAQTLAGMRLTSVLLTVALLVGARSVGGVRRGDLALLAAIGVADTLANVSFALASRTGALGVTAVLAALFPVVTAVLARVLDGERLAGLQVAGVGAALAGVALIATG